MARLSVMVLARGDSGAPQHGYSGGGGRVTLDFFLNEKTPEHFAKEAARQARLIAETTTEEELDFLDRLADDVLRED